jgi:lysophospholipase L1-like esterase
VKKTLIKLGLLLGATMVSLVIAELAMARWRPQSGAPGETKLGQWGNQVHQPSETAGLLYELRPGAERSYTPPRQGGKEIPIHINQYGMRGPDFPFEKGKFRRVAVLGDSTTFGYGVQDDESYAAVLERMLNNRDQPNRYQTLNFGVAGYSTKEEAVVLERKALAFEPDAVIIGYNLNDPDAEHAKEPLYNHFAEPAWWRYFHLTRYVTEKLRQRRIDRLADGNPVRYWHTPGRDNWAQVEDGFARIAEISSLHELPVLVVIFTAGAPRKDPELYDLKDLHAQVAAEARKNGFDVLDLSPVFSALQAEGKKTQLPHQHPNVLGQHASADAIARRLLGQGGPFGSR